MLLFEIANDSGYTRVGTPQTLVIDMTYMAEKDTNDVLEAFLIQLSVVTGAQGTVALTGSSGVRVPISGQSVDAQNPPGQSAGIIAPNHASDINIKQIHWDLHLRLEPVENEPGSFTLVVSGPVVYTWILGEVDMDPSALPSVDIGGSR